MNPPSRRKIHAGSFTTGLFVGVMLVLTFAAGAGMSKLSGPSPVEATSFTLVDKNGSVRGTWGVRDGAADLVMSDTNGNQRMGIRVQGHPVIKFWNDKGEDCMVLSGVQGGGTFLELMNGKASVSLHVAKNFAVEELKDGEGKPRFRAACLPWGEFLLSVLNENGDKTWGETNGDKKPTLNKEPAGDKTLNQEPAGLK